MIFLELLAKGNTEDGNPAMGLIFAAIIVYGVYILFKSEDK